MRFVVHASIWDIVALVALAAIAVWLLFNSRRK
jgi:hypothetical protein